VIAESDHVPALRAASVPSAIPSASEIAKAEIVRSSVAGRRSPMSAATERPCR
jgi:hypothetical protein